MRLMSALAAAGILVGLGAAPARAAEDGERITAYEVRLEARPDGSLRVAETLEYDVGSAPRHGIDRDIDVRQRYDGGRGGSW